LCRPPELAVEVDQPRGDAGEAAVALVGGVGGLHRVGDGAQEGLEARVGLALLGHAVERASASTIWSEGVLSTSTCAALSEMSRPAR
jgi:hypothetical protein